MSRRNSSSRRRNYGRRQHEVRERRPSVLGHTDWQGPSAADDWTVAELDPQRPTKTSDDGYDGYEGMQP